MLCQLKKTNTNYRSSGKLTRIACTQDGNIDKNEFRHYYTQLAKQSGQSKSAECINADADVRLHTWSLTQKMILIQLHNILQTLLGSLENACETRHPYEENLLSYQLTQKTHSCPHVYPKREHAFKNILYFLYLQFAFGHADSSGDGLLSFDEFRTAILSTTIGASVRCSSCCNY